MKRNQHVTLVEKKLITEVKYGNRVSNCSFQRKFCEKQPFTCRVVFNQFFLEDENLVISRSVGKNGVYQRCQQNFRLFCYVTYWIRYIYYKEPSTLFVGKELKHFQFFCQFMKDMIVERSLGLVNRSEVFAGALSSKTFPARI